MKHLITLRVLASCREFGIFLRHICKETPGFLALVGACTLSALIADWLLSQLIFLIERF